MEISRTVDEEGLTPPRGRARLRWYTAQLLGRTQSARRIALVERYVFSQRGRPSLGIIGSTWVERGASYWCRRVAWSFFQFLICTAFTGMFAGTLVAMWHAGFPRAASLTITVAAAGALAVSFVQMWRKLMTYGFNKITAGRYTRGSAFRVPSPLASVILPFILPVITGMLLAMFLTTLRRDFPGEGTARTAWDQYEAERARRRKARRHGRPSGPERLA